MENVFVIILIFGSINEAHTVLIYFIKIQLRISREITSLRDDFSFLEHV